MIKSQFPNKFKILKIAIWCLFGYWLLVIGISGHTVSAQTPATDSAAAIRDSVKQKVTEELAQIKQGVAKKGFIGSIVSVSDASIALTNIYGSPRKILVAADTTIKLASGADGTPGDLKAGMYVLAMGNVDSQNTMTATRLLVVGKPDTDTRTVIFDTITKVAASSFTVSSGTYKVTSTTKFTNKNKVTYLVVGTKILAIINNGSATRIQIVAAAHTSTPTTSTSSATSKP
jgi:hypothetical protein